MNIFKLINNFAVIFIISLGFNIEPKAQNTDDFLPKNAYNIEVNHENILLNSTFALVGLNGAVWPWYSDGVNSDASNSLTEYLTQVEQVLHIG